MSSKINCYFIIPVCAHFNCTGFFFNITVGGQGFSAVWQKYSFVTGFARSFSKNYYKFKNEIKIPTTVSSMDS